MSVLTALVVSVNHIPTQKLDENCDRIIILPVDYDNNQSFIPPFFDDNQLLAGQSRVTRIIFDKTNSRPLTSCNNKQFFQIKYKIHHGFTSNEEILIKNALQIVANRLFKPEILQNMYKICGTTGHFLGIGVWSQSQLKHDKNYSGEYDLLRFQLTCLKIKGENNEFPIVHIYPMYAENDIAAEGTVGCISCISYESTFSIEGRFEIKLNRYNLNAANRNVENTVYWAGAIVHEMLHNLGHKHGDRDYSNQWQINVFENCFVYDGSYSP